ncbi:MvaI/BcnI family restriction endonuclease [Enterococcus malodoratus]|uniref:MvaI/BcnI family restriction endonuclease n=1 Tax=Enterococcus malodoratus TaxID=71451 RepID=UPI0022E7B9EB|nr:MvaI/BcnI family restriction endonuclease [Enterococcus malodoratus]
MIFTPYTDELEVINRIHKYNSWEYALIRLTSTMLGKNNIDANGIFRDILFKKGILDYEILQSGGSNGIKLETTFMFNDSTQKRIMNFYRVNNKRGDRRFSIYGIKDLERKGLVNENDLLYITIVDQTVTVMNLTHNVPTDNALENVFGYDLINDAVDRLTEKVRKIAQEGFHRNCFRTGKPAPRDAGDILEKLLGIKANNSQKADFENLIELKSKTSKTMDTLFTLRPNFENTPVAIYEPKDRSRVSAFARLYGYESDRHPGAKSLYITIGSESAPQNSYGFFLAVNEENRTIELRRTNLAGKTELTAFWTFDALEKELHTKHKTTLWLDVETKMLDGTASFKYIAAELSRSPQFATFLSMVQSGAITYDWRGYTTPEGPYSGKNHGNAWRVKNKMRHLLFGSMEKIELI